MYFDEGNIDGYTSLRYFTGKILTGIICIKLLWYIYHWKVETIERESFVDLYIIEILNIPPSKNNCYVIHAMYLCFYLFVYSCFNLLRKFPTWEPHKDHIW